MHSARPKIVYVFLIAKGMHLTGTHLQAGCELLHGAQVPVLCVASNCCQQDLASEALAVRQGWERHGLAQDASPRPIIHICKSPGRHIRLSCNASHQSHTLGQILQQVEGCTTAANHFSSCVDSSDAAREQSQQMHTLTTALSVLRSAVLHGSSGRACRHA